jgi:sarcosine oxidase subunit gamma
MREHALSTADNADWVHIKSICGRTSLRLRSCLPEVVSGQKAVVLAGRELPLRVGATRCGPIQALCIGPGEWIIVSQVMTALDVQTRFAPELTQQGLVLVDLTDGLAVLELRGFATRDVLSKGCGLDFHPDVFFIGTCARTRFAQLDVIIHCTGFEPQIELYVGRSYLAYLHDWLTDAATDTQNATAM